MSSLFEYFNFAFDTPKGHPYKRGSQGERGAPKSVARKCDVGFYDPSVPGLPEVSTGTFQEVVVRSMHCLFGKGYAGGGGRLRFRRECFRRR